MVIFGPKEEREKAIRAMGTFTRHHKSFKNKFSLSRDRNLLPYSIPPSSKGNIPRTERDGSLLQMDTPLLQLLGSSFAGRASCQRTTCLERDMFPSPKSWSVGTLSVTDVFGAFWDRGP